MIRDEENPLHDLPETRGMTAREALARVLEDDGDGSIIDAVGRKRAFPANLTQWGCALYLADNMIDHLRSLGFAVLPIPVPIGKEVW
jgi:hypothetical protein